MMKLRPRNVCNLLKAKKQKILKFVKKQRKSYVYVMYDERHPLVCKIGKADDPFERLAKANNEMSWRNWYHLVCKIEYPRHLVFQAEKTYHGCYERYRFYKTNDDGEEKRTEWFAVEPEIAKHELMNKFTSYLGSIYDLKWVKKGNCLKLVSSIKK